MARVVMYATRFCPFCVRARMLLEKKGVTYDEIIVDGDFALREEMQRKSGRRTVPQIFIDDQPIGGFTELWHLERSGQLDQLLAGNTP